MSHTQWAHGNKPSICRSRYALLSALVLLSHGSRCNPFYIGIIEITLCASVSRPFDCRLSSSHTTQLFFPFSVLTETALINNARQQENLYLQRLIFKYWKRHLLLQLHRQKSYNTHYKESVIYNIIKTTNKVLITNTREMKIHELPSREFKIIILRKPNELWEMKETNKWNW